MRSSTTTVVGDVIRLVRPVPSSAAASACCSVKVPFTPGEVRPAIVSLLHLDGHAGLAAQRREHVGERTLGNRVGPDRPRRFRQGQAERRQVRQCATRFVDGAAVQCRRARGVGLSGDSGHERAGSGGKCAGDDPGT